jgi:hypothetical protein
VNCQEKAFNLYQEGCGNYRKIYCIYHNLKLKDIKGYHIHHIDGNHKNNHPENLLKCTPEEHAEFHKQENLCNWISLQKYAAVKGGKIAGKKKNTSLQMKKVWSSYSKEEREERVKKVADKVRSEKFRKNMSKILKGRKKPERSLEHILNFKKSMSTGIWKFNSFQCLSSNDLAKELNLPVKNVYRWCKFGSFRKITKKVIKRHPSIFNEKDLGKTYNEKGFFFINK